MSDKWWKTKEGIRADVRMPVAKLATVARAALILLWLGVWIAVVGAVGWFTWERWSEFPWRDFTSIVTVALVWGVWNDILGFSAAIQSRLDDIDSTLREIAEPYDESSPDLL